MESSGIMQKLRTDLSRFNQILKISPDNPSLSLLTAGLLVYIVYKIIEYLEASDYGVRPPLVEYRLPWLGSAIALGKDPDLFFSKATAKLGPVFRVKSAGHEFTYVTSPELISSVYRDAKTFAFTPIRLEMSHKVFGNTRECINSPYMLDNLFKVFHIELSPKNIEEALKQFANFAFECIQDSLEHIGKPTPTSTSLSPLIKPTAYNAALYAFFGRSYDVCASYEPFSEFDNKLLMIQAGLPHFMLKKALAAREELSRITIQYLRQPHSDCSELVRRVEEVAKRAEWSLEDTARILYSFIWALQANVPNVIYWLIAFQIDTPEGLTPLIEEIDAARNSWKENHPDDKADDKHYRWILHSQFPLLTSAIQEVLRISTSVFSIRVVQEPTELAGYEVRKGERIICVTRSVHMDDEIHQNAHIYNRKRYLHAQNPNKHGRAVPNHTMPFGGGVSMCEGRHFALGELKIFIALLLTLAKVEIDPSYSERPRLLKSRIGLGIMPPEGDMRVLVTRRSF